MKANELMIGDWVHFIDLEDCMDKDIQWTAEDYIEINDDFCEPINLTEEILKANGFQKRTESTFYLGEIFKYHVVVWIFDKEEIVIEVENDLEKRGVNKAHVCENGYVHILQHALRLCGLTELADNFKI